MRGPHWLLVSGGILWAAAFPPGQAWAPPPSPSTPIVITEVRHLSFGTCDAVGGATYTVDAADAPGAGACIGAHSARFEVTGEPNERVKLNYSKNISISNGTDTLTVKQSIAPTGGNIRFDGSGNLTVFMGGEVRIPPGGLASSASLSATSDVEVVYK